MIRANIASRTVGDDHRTYIVKFQRCSRHQQLRIARNSQQTRDRENRDSLLPRHLYAPELGLRRRDVFLRPCLRFNLILGNDFESHYFRKAIVQISARTRDIGSSKSRHGSDRYGNYQRSNYRKREESQSLSRSREGQHS